MLCLRTGFHYSTLNFLSHTANRFRRGTLVFFRKFLLSKNFMHSRVGGITVLAEISCPTVPKDFVRKPFSASKNYWYGKFFMDRRDGVSRFFVKNLLCNSVEKVRRGAILCFRKFLVSQNFKDKRGWGEGRIFTILLRKVFVSQCQQKSWSNFSVFQKNSDI